MSLFTSSQFASAAAQGTDWRDTSKTVLEKLESVRTEGQNFNFGFLYISDHLANDASSILNLFKSVLGIENWIGGVGIGICATGQSLIDVPAISAMVGTFSAEDFKIFSQFSEGGTDAAQSLKPWLDKNDLMLVLVHGDPMSEQDPGASIKTLEDITGGFLLGGLTSSRYCHAQFANTVFEGDLCGALFSQNVPIASTLSQGCHTISPVHTITRADGHTVFEINGQKALDVFEDTIRSMVIKKTDIDPDQVMVDKAAMHDKTAVPEVFQSLFEGEVHAAFPIPGSDQNDYLVRNIIGLDQEEGSLTIAHPVSNGERLLFIHRDHESVFQDLSAKLVDLRARVQKNHSEFLPKGALYISCVARAFMQFDRAQNNEMQLIRDIIGDVPLTGFYAGGEICKGRLYGYTGILTLFL